MYFEVSRMQQNHSLHVTDYLCLTSSAVKLRVLSPWPCVGPSLSFKPSVSELLADAGLCHYSGEE